MASETPKACETCRETLGANPGRCWACRVAYWDRHAESRADWIAQYGGGESARWLGYLLRDCGVFPR